MFSFGQGLVIILSINIIKDWLNKFKHALYKVNYDENILSMFELKITF